MRCLLVSVEERMFKMMNTIRVNVYDLARFLKYNAEEIIQNEESPLLTLVTMWNDSVKKNSNYGYFFDGESEEDGFYERYWMPPTAISIMAVRDLFELHKSDNIIVVPSELLGDWIDDFIRDYRSTKNSISKRRWRSIGKAKASLYPRYL